MLQALLKPIQIALVLGKLVAYFEAVGLPGSRRNTVLRTGCTTRLEGRLELAILFFVANAYVEAFLDSAFTLSVVSGSQGSHPRSCQISLFARRAPMTSYRCFSQTTMSLPQSSMA